MKRLIPVLLCAVLMPVAALADGKVAILSPQRAVLNTDLAQKVAKELQARKDFNDGMNQINALKKEGQGLIDKLKKDGAVMTDAQKQDANSRLHQIQSDLQYQGKKLEDMQSQEMQTKVFAQFQDRFPQIVNDLIKSEGIGLLLNADSGAVMQADPGFDITAKVTARLNAK